MRALLRNGCIFPACFRWPGVPCTVATAWDIDDEEAVGVVTGFYRGLTDENGKDDVGNSARSLHRVARKWRDNGSSPFIWGGYVHFGA